MQIAMKVEQRQDSLGDYFQAKAIYTLTFISDINEALKRVFQR
jgi:hypothetical protein